MLASSYRQQCVDSLRRYRSSCTVTVKAANTYNGSKTLIHRGERQLSVAIRDDGLWPVCDRRAFVDPERS
jgi:hypothetical protein